MLQRNRLFGFAVFIALLFPHAPAISDEAKELRVGAASDLASSGLIAHLAPRFRFKTRTAMAWVVADRLSPDGSIDLLIVSDTDAVAAALEAGGIRATPIAARDGTVYSAIPVATDAVPGAREGLAKRFVTWLVSGAGKRAITGFEPTTGARFEIPSGETVVRQVTTTGGDRQVGERLALQHCGRCHVINERNKYGGIGSTPSFAALRTISDWRDRFDAFWSLNPHPSFTQLTGVTEPFGDENPPHIAPIELTLDDLAAITAYAASIPPKDLGKAIQPQ